MRWEGEDSLLLRKDEPFTQPPVNGGLSEKRKRRREAGVSNSAGLCWPAYRFLVGVSLSTTAPISNLLKRPGVAVPLVPMASVPWT